MKLDDATADRLRELGATEVMLRWLREPEAVMVLLARMQCDCEAFAHEPHDQECAVAIAWRKLGMPHAEADVLNAWDEAKAYTEYDIRRLRERNASDARMRRGHEGVALIRQMANATALLDGVDARQIAGSGGARETR